MSLASLQQNIIEHYKSSFEKRKRLPQNTSLAAAAFIAYFGSTLN
jgi:hypothetical protein